eukprot:2205957-Rhodomonas_salina.1
MRLRPLGPSYARSFVPAPTSSPPGYDAHSVVLPRYKPGTNHSLVLILYRGGPGQAVHGVGGGPGYHAKPRAVQSR